LAARNSNGIPEMKSLILAAVAGVMLAPAAGLAMTDAECTQAFTQADKNNDGKIDANEGARWYAAMRVSNKSFTEGNLTRDQFIANCKEGVFDQKNADSGAPLKGANSFTENQARDRAVAHGFSEVSQLTKDNDGVWRGKAQLNGKPVNVAIDYKGNVVSQ
jgi:hypothetical protein